MSRLFKFVTPFMVALAIVALLPSAAPAVEGLGSHKGSFLFMPYWDNTGANRTYFRISRLDEPNDPNIDDVIRLHMFYLVANPAVTTVDQELRPCLDISKEQNPFTRNDYTLFNTKAHNGSWGSFGVGRDGERGWAYAYAVIDRDDGPTCKVLWDRFYGDTFIIDTQLGTTIGFPIYTQWGNQDDETALILNNDGTAGCDYSRDVQKDEGGAATNDLCCIGNDDEIACLEEDSVHGEFCDNPDYWGAVFPDTFYGTWFDGKTLRQGVYDPTLYSITAVHVADGPFSFDNGLLSGDDPDDAAQPNGAYFGAADNSSDGNYQFEGLVCDRDENCNNFPPNLVLCHDVMDINRLTTNVVNSLEGEPREGMVWISEIDFAFGVDQTEDAVAIQIDTLRGIRGVNARRGAHATYMAHNRTTLDHAFAPDDNNLSGFGSGDF